MQGIEAFTCYEIVPFADGYSFVTDKGIWYFVTLFSAKQFINKPYSENIFEFSFTADVIGAFDNRISNTIISIVKIFFTNKQNILYFICDSSDNRHHGRAKLFVKWFEKHSDNGFEMFDTQIIQKELGIEYFIYTIAHTDNKHFNDIANDIVELQKEFISYK
jgi:hypothetical protein